MARLHQEQVVFWRKIPALAKAIRSLRSWNRTNQKFQLRRQLASSSVGALLTAVERLAADAAAAVAVIASVLVRRSRMGTNFDRFLGRKKAKE